MMESTIIQRRFIESYSNTCYSVVEIAFNLKLIILSFEGANDLHCD